MIKDFFYGLGIFFLGILIAPFVLIALFVLALCEIGNNVGNSE